MMSFRAAIARRANTSAGTAAAAAVTAATAARHQSSTTQGGIGYVSFPKSTVSASTPTFSRGGMTGTGHDQYKLSDVHYDARRYAVKRSEFAAPDTDKIDLFTLNRHQLEPGVFDPTTAGGRPERAKNVKRAKAKDIDRMWTPPTVGGVAATAFSQVKPMEDQYGYTRHSPFTLESKITSHEIKPAAAKAQAQFDAVDARTSRAALRDAGNAAIDAATKRTASLMGGKMPEAYSSAAYMRKQPEKYAAPTWGNAAAAADDGAHYTGASQYDTQTPESSMMFLGGAAVIGFGVLAMLYARDYRLHHPRSQDAVARYGNRYLTEGEDAMLIEDTAGAAAANTNGRNAVEVQPAVVKRAPPTAKPAPPVKMVAPAEDAGAWARVKHWADETVDESVAKTHV